MAKHFSVDARAMLTWGRESIKDHTTAVLELVKNSYDAGATVVEVKILTGLFAEGGPHIRIADDGTGMSSEDVANHWLRLGYSAKRDEKFTARGRRKTGEKGVGRISADRLGAILELRSQAALQPPVGLRVNWNEFEQLGLDLEKIDVQEMHNIKFAIPQASRWNEKNKEFDPAPKPVSNSKNRSGTELLIRELRQDWDVQDVQELCRSLSLLTSPFEQIKDFQVRIDNNVDPTCNGIVPPPPLAAAAIEGEFLLGSEGTVTGSIMYRSPDSGRRVRIPISVPFNQLIHPRPRSGVHTTPVDPVKHLGSVSTRLLFYPQRAETVHGLDLNLSDLRQFLQLNAGVRVYRDGIRVPPYGDQGRPEGDWLALGDRKARNPAGPARVNFRVSPHQLVGGVFIGRDSNPELIDTSGREGLVAGEALSLLKHFLIGCLTRLEVQYHDLFKLKAKISHERVPSPRETVDELRDQLSDLASTIKHAGEGFTELSSNQSNVVAERIAFTTEQLKRAGRVFEELSSQAAVSRTLATIGIAAATFGHETQRGLDSMRATLAAANLLLRNGENTEIVLSELAKAMSESEKVSAWGRLHWVEYVEIDGCGEL